MDGARDGATGCSKRYRQVNLFPLVTTRRGGMVIFLLRKLRHGAFQ